MNSEEGNPMFITKAGRNSKPQGFGSHCWLHQQGEKLIIYFRRFDQ